ncbi:MAG: hypothetical protein V7K21_29945 [Nostoc sp.]|uniref:HalD/BesD family halogenase n=1 Tax=Nostoc sp. TaxID=1180 RepID=UPI002FFAB531
MINQHLKATTLPEKITQQAITEREEFIALSSDARNVAQKSIIFAEPICFPQCSPSGYEYLPDEPIYNPQHHLALEKPTKIYRLDEFGYEESIIAKFPTNLAITSPIRLLSEEGVAALHEVSLALQCYSQSCERIPNMVRGGVYRSKFVRDLCLCPIVAEFLSEIASIPLAAHSMPLMLGHFNFAPQDFTQAIDKWHTDSIAFDYVLMVTNPSQLAGGKFQYFNGTKEEGEELLKHTKDLPEDRIMTPVFPDAGYAVLQQGSMVMHRATRLMHPAERITMVNGYVSLDVNFPDQSRFADMKAVDEHHVLFPEWARYKAWLSRSKLDVLIQELPFTNDRAALCAALRSAIADVEAAIADIQETDESKMLYYGS